MNAFRRCATPAGKWPFWLCPRQAVVISVVPKYNAYAEEVAKKMKVLGFMVDADVDDGCTLNKKVRNAQTHQYTFSFVVGDEEEKARTVTVRGADGKSQGRVHVRSAPLQTFFAVG